MAQSTTQDTTGGLWEFTEYFLERNWFVFLACKYGCHETMTRAARLEQGILVTLVLPVSNVQVSQVPLHNTLVGFATLPCLKGPMGF